MDNEDKIKKIEAAKRKLEKHKKKQLALSLSNTTQAEGHFEERSSLNPTHDRHHMASSEASLPEFPENASSQSNEKFIELEEILIGKQSVIDSLIEENEALKAKLMSDDANTNDVEVPVQDKEVLNSVEDYNLKLTELEDALKERDDTITRLMDDVQNLTRNRDELQLEYTSQIDQLTTHVHTLQSQLKQAGQWLHNQLGESSALALMEAKDEILALQKDSLQKEMQMKALQEAIKQRDSAMQTLVVQINENNINYTNIHNEIQILKLQLDEKTEQLAKYESAEVDDGFGGARTGMSSEIYDQFQESLRRQQPLAFKAAEGISYDEFYVAMERNLSALRAELDEFYGIEINKIKDCLNSQHQNELRRLKTEVVRLEEERSRFSSQASKWQEQYVLLSQQNISTSDLVREVGNVLTENIRLNQLVDELRAQIHVSASKTSSSELASQVSQTVDTSSLAAFEKGLQELEKLKSENLEMEKTFFSKDQLIQELEDQIMNLKEDLRLSYDKEKEAIKEMLRSEYLQALQKNKEEIEKLSREKLKLSKEVSSWQQQYILLSQQNVSSTDLVEQIGSVVTENIRLNQLIDELNSKSIMRSREIKLVTSDNAKQSTSIDGYEIDAHLKKEIEELKRVKHENEVLEKTFFTREQFDAELQDKLDALKNEFMEMSKRDFNQALAAIADECNSQVSKLKDELENITSQKQRVDKELASWREQYIKLSQQNLSHPDLLEEITNLKNDNLRLIKSQEAASKQKLLTSDKASETSFMVMTQSSQCDLKVAHEDELKSLVYTKEQLDDEIEKHLLEQKSNLEGYHTKNICDIKNEITCDFDRDIERLKRELKVMSEEREKCSEEARLWQTQYCNLSNQSLIQNNLEEQLSLFRKENDSLKVTIEDLNSHVNSLMTDLEQKSLKHDQEMNAAIEENNKLQLALTSLNDTLKAEVESKLNVCSRLESLQEELEILRHQCNELGKHDKEMSHAKEVLEFEIKSLRTRLESSEDEKRLLASKQMDTINSLKSSMQFEYRSQMEKTENEFNEKIIELQSIHQVECDQLRSKHQYDVESFNILMTQLNSKITAVGVEKDTIEKNLNQAVETLHRQVSALEKDLKDKNDKLQDKAELEVALKETKSLYEAKISALTKEHQNNINELNNKLLSFNQMQLKLLEISEQLERVTKERDSTMESLQNVYCEKVELKLNFDKLASEKERLHKKVSKLSDKNKFLAMAKAALNKSVSLKSAIASSSHVTSEPPVSGDFEDVQSANFITDQEYKELLEEKQVLQSELIECIPESVVVNIGSRVVVPKDKKSAFEKLEETCEDNLEDSHTLNNELKTKHALEMLTVKKKQIALIEKLQTFMESQIKMDVLHETESEKLPLKSKESDNLLGSMSEGMPIGTEPRKKDFSTQCSEEISLFWVKTWLKRIMIYFEDENKLQLESGDQAYHKMFSELSEKILDFKSELEQFSSQQMMSGGKDVSCDTDGLASYLLGGNEGVSNESISQMALEFEYTPDGFQDIYLDDHSCADEVLVSDSNPQYKFVKLTGKSEHTLVDEEHSPRKVVSHARLVEIQHLRSQLSEATEKLHAFDHEKNVMAAEFDIKLMSLMEEHDMNKFSLMNEIASLKKEISDLAQKLKQNNLSFERIVAEKDLEIANKVSEVTRIEELHRQAFSDAVAKHEEKEAAHSYALSTSKMQISDLESRVEAVCKEKFILEQEFLNEMEELTKEHDSRIKSLKESFGKENRQLSSKLNEYQEKILNLSDELELFHADNLRLQETLSNMKAEECLAKAKANSQSSLADETWTMRLNSLEEAKLDIEKSLENAKIDIDKLTIENTKLCLELEGFKNNIADSVSVEVETDAVYGVSDDVTNRILCLREEKALLASMVERLTNEKDQLLVAMMSRNQHLEFDLSNMDLEDDEVERDERSDDPRIKLLEAEKELLANMLEKVSTENEKLLSYLKQKECVEVDDAVGNELKGDALLAKLKSENVPTVDPDRDSPAFSDQLEAFQTLETEKRSLELTIESLNLLLNEKQQTIELLSGQLDFSSNSESKSSFVVHDLQSMNSREQLQVKNGGSELMAFSLPEKEQSVELLINQSKECTDEEVPTELRGINECKRMDSSSQTSDLTSTRCSNLQDDLIELRRDLISGIKNLSPESEENYDISTINIDELIQLFSKLINEASIARVTAFPSCPTEHVTPQTERLVGMKILAKIKPKVAVVFDNSNQQKFENSGFVTSSISDIELQKLANFNAISDNDIILDTPLDNLMEQKPNDQQSKLLTLKKAKLLKSRKLQEKNEEKETLKKQLADLTELNRALENANQVYAKEIEALSCLLAERDLLLQQYEVKALNEAQALYNNDNENEIKEICAYKAQIYDLQEEILNLRSELQNKLRDIEEYELDRQSFLNVSERLKNIYSDDGAGSNVLESRNEEVDSLLNAFRVECSSLKEEQYNLVSIRANLEDSISKLELNLQSKTLELEQLCESLETEREARELAEQIIEEMKANVSESDQSFTTEEISDLKIKLQKKCDELMHLQFEKDSLIKQSGESSILIDMHAKKAEELQKMLDLSNEKLSEYILGASQRMDITENLNSQLQSYVAPLGVVMPLIEYNVFENNVLSTITTSSKLSGISDQVDNVTLDLDTPSITKNEYEFPMQTNSEHLVPQNNLINDQLSFADEIRSSINLVMKNQGQQKESLDCEQPLNELKELMTKTEQSNLLENNPHELTKNLFEIESTLKSKNAELESVTKELQNFVIRCDDLNKELLIVQEKEGKKDDDITKLNDNIVLIKEENILNVEEINLLKEEIKKLRDVCLQYEDDKRHKSAKESSFEKELNALVDKTYILNQELNVKMECEHVLRREIEELKERNSFLERKLTENVSAEMKDQDQVKENLKLMADLEEEIINLKRSLENAELALNKNQEEKLHMEQMVKQLNEEAQSRRIELEEIMKTVFETEQTKALMKQQIHELEFNLAREKSDHSISLGGLKILEQEVSHLNLKLNEEQSRFQIFKEEHDLYLVTSKDQTRQLLEQASILEKNLIAKSDDYQKLNLELEECKKNLDDKCHYIEKIDVDNNSLKMQLNDFTSVQQELKLLKEILENEKIAKAELEALHGKEVSQIKSEIECLKSDLQSKHDECLSLHSAIQDLNMNLDSKCERIKTADEANNSLKMKMDSLNEELTVLIESLDHEKRIKHEMEISHAADVTEMKTEGQKLKSELEAKAEKYDNLQVNLNALQESLNEKCVILKSIQEENVSLKIQISDLEAAQKELIASKEVVEHENLVKANYESEMTNRVQDLEKKMKEKCSVIEAENVSLKVQLEGIATLQNELTTAKEDLRKEKNSKADFESFYAKEVLNYKDKIENLESELRSKNDDCYNLRALIQELQKDLDVKHDILKKSDEANASLKVQINSIQDELIILRGNLEHEMNSRQEIEMVHAADVLEMETKNKKLKVELEAKAEKCNSLQLDLNALQESLNEKCVILKSIEEDNICLKTQIDKLEAAQKELISSREILEHENLVKANLESEFTNIAQDFEKKMKEKCDVVKSIKEENASLKAQLKDFVAVQHELATTKEVLQNEKHSKAQLEAKYAKEHETEIENLRNNLEAKLRLKDDECFKMQEAIKNMQIYLDERNDVMKNLEKNNNYFAAKLNEMESLEAELAILRGSLEEVNHDKVEMKRSQTIKETELRSEIVKLTECRSKYITELNMLTNELEETKRALDLERFKFEENSQFYNSNIELLKKEHDRIFDRLGENIDAIVSSREIASRKQEKEKSKLFAENLKLQEECQELKAAIEQFHCHASEQTLEIDKANEMLELAQNSLIQVQLENQKCKEDFLAKCNELQEKDTIIQEFSRKYNDLENDLQLRTDKDGPTEVEYERLKIECDRALNTIRNHSDEIMALKIERDMLQNEMKDLAIDALNKQKTIDVLQETLEKKHIEIDAIQRQSEENEKSNVKINEALNHEILKLSEQINSSLTNTKLMEMEILRFQAERKLISEKLGSASLDSEVIIEKIDNLQLLINKFDAQEEQHNDQINLLTRQIEDLKCTTLEFEMLYKTKCSEITNMKSSHEQLISTYSCEMEDLKNTITSERSEFNLLKCCLTDIEHRLALLESDSRILENELHHKDCEISDKQSIIDKLEASVKDLTTCLHLERNLASEKDFELLNLRAEIMTLRNQFEPGEVLAKQSEVTDDVDVSRSQLSDTSLSMETCSEVIKQDSMLSSGSENIIDGEIKSEIGSEDIFSDSVGTPPEISSMSSVHDIESQSYHADDLEKASKFGIIGSAKSSKASEADDDFDESKQTQTGSEILKQESMSLKRQLFEMESMLKDTINELHMTLNETESSGETCNSLSEECLKIVESDRESLQSGELRSSSEKEVETIESAVESSAENRENIEVALGTTTADAYNYSAEDVIVAVDKRVESMSKNKASCFVFDYSTIGGDDKNVASSSKTAKLEHAKLLKTKKLQEKEMEKLKLKSAELEDLCNKLKNDYASAVKEIIQISSEKCEAIKQIELLEEELGRMSSEAFNVDKIDQSITCCLMDDKKSEKAEMDCGTKIDLSDSTCQTSSEVGLIIPSASQFIRSNSEANMNEVLDNFRHFQEYEVQEVQGDIIEEWKQVDDHTFSKVSHNISQDTQTDFSEFSAITLKELRDVSVEATICLETIDIQTDAKVYNDASVETTESQNGQNLEAELKELKTLNEELRQEIVALDGEKLDLMNNCLEMKKRQPELDSQNKNLVDELKLLSIEKKKWDLYEKEHEKLLSTLDKVSTCDKEVGTSELSLTGGRGSILSCEEKVNLRRILQSIFNIPIEMDDNKIEAHLLTVRDNLEKHAEVSKKMIVSDEEEEKKLNEIGLDKVQLETSILALKSLTVNSSDMTEILHVLEKQIEMFFQYQSKMTAKCDELLGQCKKVEEENGHLTNECEKLKSEYETLKQDSERAYNALKLSCFDNINRNDGWNNATNEDGLSTGLMSTSLLSPGLKSPSSCSGSETFLLSDDGRTSCFEIDELQAKIHHLEKENNELKLNANRDDSGASDGHLRRSDSSAGSHALQGSSDDGDKVKLGSHSSHESECQRGRKSFSPSVASLHADRFLIRSPRSITSTSNDYQLEVEEAQGKTIEDYMCLQNDFKRFKLKVRTEYTKLKNRLVETLKDYNYLKMKYQEVCDANRFHYLCDNNSLLTENNALKIQIQDLENAISRLVQENEALSGAIETEGEPDASSEMKRLNEKISQQELQISILQSDCNCLSGRNAILEKQLLETEKVSTFELNSDLLEARTFDLNRTSDASIQVDEVPDTFEQSKATLCLTEINKEIHLESLTLVQNETEEKEVQKASKPEKPISRLPLRKGKDQKNQKSKAEMPKVLSKSAKQVDIQVSAKSPPPKESKTSDLVVVPASKIPEQKCKRCQELEKECGKLKEQASKYAEELEVLKNNADMEPAQLIKLREQKKTKTADLLCTSCKTPSQRASLSALTELVRGIANQEKLTKSLSLVKVPKKERTLKLAKTSLKSEKPSSFPLGAAQSLESELAEVKACHETLLDDKARPCIASEERTPMFDEICRVETLLLKERCNRLPFQDQLKSKMEQASLLRRALTHNQKCILAPKITSLSDSLLLSNHPSPDRDFLPLEPLSLETTSLSYTHSPVSDDKDRPNRYCCEGFQIEKQIRDEINDLKESILSLKHENQLLKLDATSMKSQLALLQAPDIDCLIKEDDQSISNEESLNQMSESLEIIPLENIIVSNENAHSLNGGMKSCDAISFEMMQSIEDVDKEEWMKSESMETKDLSCQDSSLLNSEFPFMIQRNLGKYDILLEDYEHLKREYETLEKSYMLTSDEKQCLSNDLELCRNKDDAWTEKIDQLLLHLQICQGETSELLEDKTNLSNKIRKLEERQQALLAQIENIQKSCHESGEMDKIQMFSKETQIIPDDYRMLTDCSGKVELLGIGSEDFKASCEYLKNVVIEKDVFIETNNQLQSLNSQLEIQKSLLLLQELDELKYYSSCLASSMYESSEELSILQDHCKSIHSKNRIFETKNDVLQKEYEAISLKYAEVCNLNEKTEIMNAKQAIEIKLLKENIMKLSLENESLSSLSNSLQLQIADLSTELKENQIVLKSKCSLVTELSRENTNLLEVKKKYGEVLKILRIEMLSIKSSFLAFKDLHNSARLCAKERLEELNLIFDLKENERIELKESASAIKRELERLGREKNVGDSKNFEIQNRVDVLSGEIKTLEKKLSDALQDNQSLHRELVALKESACASEEESKRLVNSLNAYNCELEQKLHSTSRAADTAKVIIDNLNYEIDKSNKNYESKVIQLKNSQCENDLANDSLRRLEADCAQLLISKEQVQKENAELIEKIDFLNNELESTITKNQLFERDSRIELESIEAERNAFEKELKCIITEMDTSSKLLSDLKVQNSNLESKIASLQGRLEFKDSSLEKLENNLNVLTLENVELKNLLESSKIQYLSEIHESDILHAKCLKKLEDEKDDISSTLNLLRRELSELLNKNDQMTLIITDLQIHLREAHESLESQKHKTDDVENTNQHLMVKKLELSKEVEAVKADNLRLAELNQDLKNNLCLVENSEQLEKTRVLDEQKKLLFKLESMASDKEALETTCSMQESKVHLVTEVLKRTKEELDRKVQDLETKLENYLELGSKYEDVLNENSFLKAEKCTSSNLLEELHNRVKDLTEMLNHQTEISNQEKKTIFNGFKLLASENYILEDLEAMDLEKAVECIFMKLNEQLKYFKELWEVEKQNVIRSEQKVQELSAEIESVRSQNLTLVKDVDKLETELQSLSISKNQQQALLKDHADKIEYYNKHISALEDNIQAFKEKNMMLKATLDNVNSENHFNQNALKESLNCYKTELENCRDEKRIAYQEINKLQNKVSHVVKSIELLCKKVNCDYVFPEDFVWLEEESWDNTFETIEAFYSLSANENTRLKGKINDLETELDGLKTSLKLKETEHEDTIRIAEQNINLEKAKLKEREGMSVAFSSSVVESLASLKSEKDMFDIDEREELESLMNELPQSIACQDYFSKISSVLSILVLKLLEFYGKAKQSIEIESRFLAVQLQERKYKLELELHSGELDYYKSENTNLLEEKLKLETDLKALKTERDNLAAELDELKSSFKKNAKLHEQEINDLQSIVEMVSKAKDNLERDMVKERAEFVEKLDKSRFDCLSKSEKKISQLSSDLSSMEKTMAHLKDESRMHREEKELLQLRIMHLTRECQMQEKHINNLKEQLNLQTNQILESVKEHEETIKLLMELKMGQQLSREEQKGDIVRLEEEILRIESDISHSILNESLKVGAQAFQEKSAEAESEVCSTCEALKIRNEQLLEEAATLKTTLAELRMENSNLFQDNKALDSVVGKQFRPLHRSFSRLSLQRISPDLRNFAAWKSRESLAKAESESLGSLISLDPRFSFDIPAEVVNLQERLVTSEKIIQQMHDENNFLREELFNKQQEVTNNLESLIAKSKKKKGLLKISTSELNYDALTEITGQQLKILQEEKDVLLKQVKDLKLQCSAAEQHMAQVALLSEELRIERDSHRALSLAKEKLEVDLLKERLNVEREMRQFQQFKEMLSKKERIESQILTSGEQKSTAEQILGPYASSVLKEEQKNLSIKIRRTIFLRDVAIQSGKSYLACPARKSAQIYKQMASSKSKEKSVVLDCGCVAELGTMKLKTGCRYHHLVEKMRRELKMQEMQNK